MSVKAVEESEFQDDADDDVSLRDFELQASSSDDESHTTRVNGWQWGLITDISSISVKPIQNVL